MLNYMPSWEELLGESDQLFDYLCHHFHDLFDEKNNIKHFDMRPSSAIMMGYYEEVNEQYGSDVHDAIIPWIHEEYRNGRLTCKEYWKIYRVPYQYNSIYYGYRKLFLFDKYYFQLTLANDKNMIDGIFTHYVCFEVALYGWKNDNVELTSQPYNTVSILDDMMIPIKDWMRPE